MACENMNRWAGTFDLQKTSLYNLENCNVYLFQTKDVITSGIGGNEDMHGRMPIYHVWADDKQVYCGQSMNEAYTIYRKAVNEALVRSLI